MKIKILAVLWISLLSFMVVHWEASLTSSDIKKWTDKGYTLSANSLTYGECNSQKEKYNQEFVNYKRSDCFKDEEWYKYFICQTNDSCGIGSNAVPNSVAEQTDNTANTSKTTNVPNQAKLDKFLVKLKWMRAVLNNDDRYEKILNSLLEKLNTLWAKYRSNIAVSEMVDYLVKWTKDTKEELVKDKGVDSFFCELNDNCWDSSSGSAISSGNIVSVSVKSGTIACWDPDKSDYTTYSPGGNIVKLQRDYCNKKWGKAWIMCGDGKKENIKSIDSIKDGEAFSCITASIPTNTAKKDCVFDLKPYFDLGLKTTFFFDNSKIYTPTPSGQMTLPWDMVRIFYVFKPNGQSGSDAQFYFQCTDGSLKVSDKDFHAINPLPGVIIEGSGTTTFKDSTTTKEVKPVVNVPRKEYPFYACSTETKIISCEEWTNWGWKILNYTNPKNTGYSTIAQAQDGWMATYFTEEIPNTGVWLKWWGGAVVSKMNWCRNGTTTRVSVDTISKEYPEVKGNWSPDTWSPNRVGYCSSKFTPNPAIDPETLPKDGILYFDQPFALPGGNSIPTTCTNYNTDSERARFSKDFAAFFENNSIGFSQPWAGGKITLEQKDLAVYMDASGQKITIAKNSSPTSITGQSLLIREQWGKQYGLNANGIFDGTGKCK